MKRRWKFLFKLLLAFFLVFFLFLLEERIRGQWELHHYESVLAAQGEKLNFKEFSARSNAGENGAPEIMEAIKQLQEGQILPGDFPPGMEVRPSGHAIACSREKEWIGYRHRDYNHAVTNGWPSLAPDLATNQAVLDQIRVLLNKPVLDNNLDLTRGVDLQFAHLSPVKILTEWFRTRAQFSLPQGNIPAALPDLTAGIEVQRLLAEDKIVISELVRIAIMSIDRATIWEALQAEGWTDDELAGLAQACQKPEFMLAMARALEGERILANVGYDQCRKSNEVAFNIMVWESNFYGGETNLSNVKVFFKKQIYCRIWRFAWSYQDQARNLKYLQKLIELTRKMANEKSYVSVSADINTLTEEGNRWNWYDRLRYPDANTLFTLPNAIKKAPRIETERSQILCAIALKRYFLRHGNFPASLNNLVPEFLTAVPLDYMDGKPMKYRLNSDGSFTLYSVGENGTDDGGDNAMLRQEEHSPNLWKRKDVVWPSAASAEEVNDWWKESLRNN